MIMIASIDGGIDEWNVKEDITFYSSNIEVEARTTTFHF